MPKINENTLAKDVADREGGAQKVNLAQIKEIVKCTLDELAENYQPSEVMALVEKHV
ncbi:MAG: hypothetical protein ACE5H1_11155 [Thermodesulfobacteriota bacterium]